MQLSYVALDVQECELSETGKGAAGFEADPSPIPQPHEHCAICIILRKGTDWCFCSPPPPHCSKVLYKSHMVLTDFMGHSQKR